MDQSRPAWGAWIEISCWIWYSSSQIWSRPAWGAWIEMPFYSCYLIKRLSRPAWGAWIEIIVSGARASKNSSVAPRMGRVD